MERSLFIMIMVLTLGMTALSAQETIQSIEISGLKRTKESTIRNIIKVEEGDEITDGLTEEIDQRLRRTGLFQDDIDVEIRRDLEGNILIINAKDRWTLIGMPYFASANGDMSGGVFAYESNLFGTRKALIASFSASESSGIQAMTVYQDPSLFQSGFNLSLAFAGGTVEKSFTDLSGEEEWEHIEYSSLSFSTGLGYQFSDAFMLNGSLSGTFLDEAEEDLYEDKNFGISASTSFDKRYYHELFSSGFYAALGGQLFLEPQGDISQRVSLSTSYGFVPAEWLLIQGTACGGLTNDDFHNLFQLGGITGSRTLPSRAIASGRFVSGEVLSEFRFLKASWCSMTIPVYYEAGLLEDFHEEDQAYQGFGFGYRLYLSKINVPALGLDYTYNITTSTPGMSFFLGMSF